MRWLVLVASMLAVCIPETGQAAAEDKPVSAPRKKGRKRGPPPPPPVEEAAPAPPPPAPALRGPELDGPREPPPPPTPAPVDHAPGVVPVIVMPLEARAGLSPDVADLVTNELARVMAEQKGFDVRTFREVQGAMANEALKMTAGCTSASCAAEIAGALNAEFVIIGTLSRVDNDFIVLQASKVRARDANVAGRSTRRFPANRVNLMLSQMPLVGADLLGVTASAELLARQKAIDAQAPKQQSNALPWVLRTVGGVGGAAAAALLVATLGSAAVPVVITAINWREGPVLPNQPQRISQSLAMLSNLFLLLAVGGAGLVLLSLGVGAGLLGASFTVGG